MDAKPGEQRPTASKESHVFEGVEMIGRCTAFIAVLFLVVAALPSSAQLKGQKVSVKGEVVDLWCYLEGGDRVLRRKSARPAAPRPATRSAYSTPRATCTS